jgi:hypothetical protein
MLPRSVLHLLANSNVSKSRNVFTGTSTRVDSDASSRAMSALTSPTPYLLPAPNIVEELFTFWFPK